MQQHIPPDGNVVVQHHHMDPGGIPSMHMTPHYAPVDQFPPLKNVWNSNKEIANLLYAAPTQPQWVSTQTIALPASGTQLIFMRYDGAWYKTDGFLWRKRKEQKIIREDHMKLKVHKQDLISANYAHSAVVPTFHRRVYWLTHATDFVLVHYLNTTNMEKGMKKTALGIAECLRTNRLQLSHEQLCHQLAPIYAHCLKSEEVPILASAVMEELRRLDFVEQKPTGDNTRQYQLERRNSCSSAFRKGLSSMALRRQPSANSEIDANYLGILMKKYGCGSQENRQCGRGCGPSTSLPRGQSSATTAGESLSVSGETDVRSSNQDEDMSVCQMQPSSSNGAGSSPSMAAQEQLSRMFHAGSEKVVQKPPPLPSSTTVQANNSTTTKIATIPIVEAVPDSCSLKGEKKIIVVGGWYMKGHEYKLRFGEEIHVPASLIQAGVLCAMIPKAKSAGTVPLAVFCNGQIVSTSMNFTYFNEEDTFSLLQSLMDRVTALACALEANDCFQGSTSEPNTQDWFMQLIYRMESKIALTSSQPSVKHPSLLAGVQQMPTRTVIHVAAALDFDKLVRVLLEFSRRLPYCRELDALARDLDGSTPLHYAAKYGSVDSAREIIQFNRETTDVLDDRGKTPFDMASDERMRRMTSRAAGGELQQHLESGGADHLDATKLWVMTNGKTVTRENLLLKKSLLGGGTAGNRRVHTDEMSSGSLVSEMMVDDNLEYERHFKTDGEADDRTEPHPEDDDEDELHVEISMDTDVHVPDSPKMARLFQVVTSPGVLVTDGVRAKMAVLAQQIIDALPERIKHNDAYSPFEDDYSFSSATNNPTLTQMSGAGIPMGCDDLFDVMMFEPSTAHNQMAVEQQMKIGNVPPQQNHHIYQEEGPYPSSSTPRQNLPESESIDFDKDLGEFFTLHLDPAVDPIQQRLGDLKLSDDEQREVYEAAMVIQRAYREYRARNTSRRQADIERRAAVTIQCCYRRYKQFCYFKKLHNAAIVVQKHFRMKKRDDKEEIGDEVSNVPEHPTLEGQSIRIQIPHNNSTLLRQHRAATTIQLAYRGHRKRQAAARKIQKFMKQSRNKLRKMLVQNEDAMCSPPHPPMAPMVAHQLDSHQKQQQQQQIQSIMASHQSVVAAAAAVVPINNTHHHLHQHTNDNSQMNSSNSSCINDVMLQPPSNHQQALMEDLMMVGSTDLQDSH